MAERLNLNYESYKDRVYACWIGKNIGGTMGAPYEGARQALDVKGYATEANVVLPNDDLDLQLVWLYAVEKLGCQQINAAVLGEFWLSYIVPHWNEYGIGKINLERGLFPPLSGDYMNDWQNSNGAWIRTEIWACLAPGCPDVAAKCAIEDAKVDHGSGEGTYAAAFVAAMQSAAFVLRDLRESITVGLSKIPADCRVADSVRCVLECYENGKSARETRDIILERNSDIGDGWFEAPSNVAYVIIGLVFGEGDFKRSMLTTINCGDDTDCTAATVGATLGIIGGTASIPEDWRTHIGDNIVTISINRGRYGRTLPSTCTELAERVIRQAPGVLLANRTSVSLSSEPDMIPEGIIDDYVSDKYFKNVLETVKPNRMTFTAAALTAIVHVEDGPDIAPMGEKKIHIRFKNDVELLDDNLYNLSFRWWLPEGFTVDGRRGITMMHRNAHQTATADESFVIHAGETVERENRVVLEVTALSRPTPLYIPIVLLG